MLSLGKIIHYVRNLKDPEIVKAYYEKCVTGLKDTNKRSNYVSNIMLVVLLFNFFPEKITQANIHGVIIDIKIITVITPTILSFLLFEWLMVAKRRRDLIIGAQAASYRVFDIVPLPKEEFFPNFNPNTLNVIPYSFMAELTSIDSENAFKLWLTRVTIVLLPLPFLLVIVHAFMKSFAIYNMHLCYRWPDTSKDFFDNVTIYLCVISSSIFIIWTLFYYYTEFANLKKLLKAAEDAAK